MKSQSSIYAVVKHLYTSVRVKLLHDTMTCMCYVLSGLFATAGSPSYIHTHTILVVIIGPYTFESRIHKVAAELSNIIEGLVGVQLCTLSTSKLICLTDGTVNITSASGIVPTM